MARKKRRHLPPNLVTHVANLSHDGRGIARIHGKTTFLSGALPAEQVEFRYQKIKNDYDEGTVTRVLQASTQRDLPRCPHYTMCGGCSLQHVKPDAQIHNKLHTLLELIQHAGIPRPDLLPTITGNVWGYRRKARLSVKFLPQKNKVLVGFREKNGRFVADLTRCETLDPRIGEKITAFSNLFYQLNIRAQIPQMEIATSTDKAAIIIRHLVAIEPNDLNHLRTFAAQHDFQLYLQPAGPDSIYLDWPQQVNPLLQYTLQPANITLQFHPQQFIQVNQSVNDQMVTRVIELLDIQADDQVLDLFCGIGNFSLPIAKRGVQVIGVEGNAQAVQQAKANALLNYLTKAQFYCADLSHPPYHQNWSTQTFTKVILDPPRTGAKELITQLPAWRAQKIVYVSCNPITLVRDIRLLHTTGYSLKKLGVMDMFPHTQHVETIAFFTRK